MTTLVIVESPGKLKHLREILGPGYRIEASVGHVRDLPKHEMGVEPPDFVPQYEQTERGADVLKRLAVAVEQCRDVVLASDPDREGEAIAWHLNDALHLRNATRVTFGSITDADVKAGMAAPRSIDMALVHAQEARRVLDRLVGYTVSPVLAKKAGTPLTAGRVQSPAVRIVVDREHEIRSFKPTEHYTAALRFNTESATWSATWNTKDRVDDEHPWFTDRAYAEHVAAIRDVRVTRFEDSVSHEAPPAPFTSASLQMAAQHKLKFRPATTMELAQKLYERGLITYHRTDSPNLSAEGFAMLKAWATAAHVPVVPECRTWKSKAGSQEAHECIRPARFDDKDAGDTPDEKALYTLIRRRAIASQMPSAVYAVRTATLDAEPIDGKPVSFVARGRTQTEPGWRALYGADAESEGATKKPDEDDDNSAANPVPNLTEGQALHADDGVVVTKTTKAPPRYKLATLIKRMVDLEIGRPSTYASIMENITGRGYVTEDKRGFLTPTATGEAIVGALVGVLDFVDLDYTKHLEAQLDAVANGTLQYLPVVTDVHAKLHERVGRIGDIKVAGLSTVRCPACGSPMRRIKGKSGHFWGCSSHPKCSQTLPDVRGKPDFDHPHTVAAPSTEFMCPDCGKPLIHRVGEGKRGHYDFWSCTGWPECKRSFKSGPDGKPNFAPPAAPSSEFVCPDCGKPLVHRVGEGKRGHYDFWSCTGWPECKRSFKSGPDGKPILVAAPRTPKGPPSPFKCPDCGKPLAHRVGDGKRGHYDFWGCTGWPKCNRSFKTGPDGKPTFGEAARARRVAASA
ncbi:MAG TPA: type I DNA topoisomerase [Nevskiaceae bacterium]|nr:type I DNA topoisomerase [Nevskiaceae bacterium]